LDAYNVSHELLIIELTEHSLLTDIEIAKKQLIELHQEHVSFAIDDFGTGFSSLSYLHELNFDILKIDRSFIKDYPKNDEGVILKAMIRMVKELGIAVVMEGVELPEQLVLLKELKVPYYQGFIFSKAVPKDQFLEMLQG
ncbi:MAG: EAL domain-containing protein, partial [Sphaerochaetaceae bacterium]